VRGPVVFLVSLAAVTLAAFSLFLPLHRQRLELSAGILEAAAISGAARTLETPPQVAKLETALGGRTGEAEAVVALRGLALDFAPIDLIEVSGRKVTFPADWKDVPRLLARLARRDGIVLRSFSAVPAGEASRCRVTLEIAASGEGNETR